jgi:hypothetical protein
VIEPGSRLKALVERFWIVTFIVLAFVFAVLAPWYLGLPLALFSSGLGILDGLAHRALLGRQWVAIPAIFGVLTVVLAVLAAVRGGRGLDVFAG